MKVDFKIKIPSLPNYLRCGVTEEYMIDVADLTDEALREIAKDWSKALLKHADQRRKQTARKRGGGEK